jgi:hypothetical protein
MDKKLKGKPGESRRRKATELPRYSQRNVSGAARFDGWNFPVCSFLSLPKKCGVRVSRTSETWIQDDAQSNVQATPHKKFSI